MRAEWSPYSEENGVVRWIWVRTLERFFGYGLRGAGRLNCYYEVTAVTTIDDRFLHR